MLSPVILSHLTVHALSRVPLPGVFRHPRKLLPWFPRLTEYQ